jgi:hypothetical protein
MYTAIREGVDTKKSGSVSTDLRHEFGYSVSIFVGEDSASPTTLHDSWEVANNPVLYPAMVTNMKVPQMKKSGFLVADPFLIKHDETNTWIIFAESGYGSMGVISYFHSKDLKSWKHGGMVKLPLHTPWVQHLSYPFTFKLDGKYYMLSNELGAWYVATPEGFPTEWAVAGRTANGGGPTGTDCSPWQQPSDKRWYAICMQGEWTSKTIIQVYHSDNLLSGWTKHPAGSPLFTGTKYGRPAGKPVVHEGRVFAMIMDLYPTYGSQVKVVEITATRTTLHAEEAMGSPATRISARPLPRFFKNAQEGDGYDTRMKNNIGTTLQYDYKAARNHHVCAVWDASGGRWVAAVDFVGYTWAPEGQNIELEPNMALGQRVITDAKLQEQRTKDAVPLGLGATVTLHDDLSGQDAWGTCVRGHMNDAQDIAHGGKRPHSSRSGAWFGPTSAAQSWWERVGASILACSPSVSGVSLANSNTLATPGARLLITNQTLFYLPCVSNTTNGNGGVCVECDLMRPETMVSFTPTLVPSDAKGPALLEFFLQAKQRGENFWLCDPDRLRALLGPNDETPASHAPASPQPPPSFLAELSSPERSQWTAFLGVAKKWKFKRVAEMDGTFTYYACAISPATCPIMGQADPLYVTEIPDGGREVPCCRTVESDGMTGWMSSLKQLAAATDKSSVFLTGGGPLFAWRELHRTNWGLGNWDHDFDFSVSPEVHSKLQSGIAVPRGWDGYGEGSRLFYGYPLQQSKAYPWDHELKAAMNVAPWAPPISEEVVYWHNYFKRPYGDAIDSSYACRGPKYTAHALPSTNKLPPSLCTVGGRLLQCPFDLDSYIQAHFGQKAAMLPPDTEWNVHASSWVQKPDMPNYMKLNGVNCEREQSTSPYTPVEVQRIWRRSVAAVAATMLSADRRVPHIAGEISRLTGECRIVRDQTTVLCNGCELEACPTEAARALSIWDEFLATEELR